MLLNVSILGFILAGVILIFSSYKKSTNALLAAYLLFSNLFSLVYYVIFESGNATLNTIFAIHATPFYFLAMPFLHLYIISHRKAFQCQYKHLLYFVPFLLVLLNISPYLVSPMAVKIALGNSLPQNPEGLYRTDLLFLSYYQQSLARPIFNVILILFTLYTYYKERATLEFQQGKFNERNFVVLVMLISATLNAISFVLILNKWAVQSWDINLFSFVSNKLISKIFNYLSAGQNLILLFFPQILFREQINAEPIPPRKKEMSPSEEGLISQERLLEIDQIIQGYVTTHPYLTKGFTVTQMTLDTSIPAHQLSMYFKDFLKTNFNDWKNQLRIDFVINEIKSGNWANDTIATMATNSGFSSRSNFNKAFVERTNQTPSEYFKGIKG